MQTIVADINIEGHIKALARMMRSQPPWDFYLNALIAFKQFEDLGLSRDANDREIWNTLQAHRVLLITDNRNRDDDNSLQAVIEDSNTSTSLPVITIGDAARLLADRDYASRTIEKLIDHVMFIDEILGAGRIYIP